MTKKSNSTHSTITNSGSAFKTYQTVVVGLDSFWATVYFEACVWLSPIPGAIGLLLRSVFWPRMFYQCGDKPRFGQGIILRHPNRVSIGSNVVVSENCILDARNEETPLAIEIQDNVILANNVCLSAKLGTIHIGENSGLGLRTTVQSTNNCPTTIGSDCIIGPHCYLVAGGTYNLDDLKTPIRDQGIKQDSGCHLRNNVWLGGQVSVIGNVVMDEGSVAATGAVVVKSVDKNTIVGGVPAKTISVRT